MQIGRYSSLQYVYNLGERQKFESLPLTIVITSKNPVDSGDKAPGFVETRIVVMHESVSKDWVPIPRDLELGYHGQEEKDPQKPQVVSNKAKRCPNLLSLSNFPGFSSQNLQPRTRSCDLHMQSG